MFFNNVFRKINLQMWYFHNKLNKLLTATFDDISVIEQSVLEKAQSNYEGDPNKLYPVRTRSFVFIHVSMCNVFR